MILSLATLFAKEYIIVKADENYHVVRNEKKKLGQFKKTINKYNRLVIAFMVIQIRSVNFHSRIWNNSSCPII